MPFKTCQIIKCSMKPAQKAMVCRSSVLGISNSSSICYYDGPDYSLGTKRAVFGNNCLGCWVVDDSELVGTAAVTASNTTVTGTGTVFLTDISVGDKIIVGCEQRTVSTIDSDTSLTVSEAFPKTESGKEIRNLGQLY